MGGVKRSGQEFRYKPSGQELGGRGRPSGQSEASPQQRSWGGGGGKPSGEELGGGGGDKGCEG